MGLKYSRDQNQENPRPILTREEEEFILLCNDQKSKNGNRTEEEYCCSACVCETTRRERTKLERLALHSNQQGGGGGGEGEGEGEGGRDGVDLHPCDIQVVITVNTPPGFQLSLDYLTCFDRTQNKHEQPGHDYYKYGWIVGASNGLLLCSTGKFCQKEYYITNPLTKQWVALPPAPRVHTYAHVGFIFDPCSSTKYKDQAHTRAYHDPLHCSACKFKVVRFYDEYQCHQLRSHFEVETFSSDVGQWNIAAISSPEAFHWNSNMHSPSSFFHKRCLHWVADGGYLIVVYDPYNNKFRGFIRGPKRTQVCQRHSFNIGFSRGSFWLCQVSPTSGYLRFWELKGYDDDIDDDTFDKCYWNPHRLCNLNEMKGGRPEWVTGECFEKVVAFHPHDPDIVFLQVINIDPDNYVVSCNLRTKTLGPAILKHHGNRCQGDIVTLVLPPSSDLVP